ncbi:cation:proton antiporter domain-containing protein [Actinophytocola xanthii]|uniref:Cation/H+ exchanger transmembrane domain-containing protein n=1 Tax=Actinophytocola xanthii TaxID=1912961 RepID=A0A1Q8C8X3_9PSEU|nr:cation:proton antiporter [Actinophytocola xanthii]OLF10819.1 hypothetical protein BU204_30900 [Actinophytocola xanthii]
MPVLVGVGLAAVLLAAAVLGDLMRRLRQPPVIGEITAVFLLGPLGLGAVSPGLHALLFPPQSLPLYAALGHVGLVLFIFSLGHEFRSAALSHRSEVMAATTAGFLVPAVLGGAVGLLVYGSTSTAGGVGSCLFFAVAISATALPVLSRILLDYHLSETRLGRTALPAAAMIDLLAWLMLAVAVGVTGSDGGGCGGPAGRPWRCSWPWSPFGSVGAGGWPRRWAGWRRRR